MARIRAFSPFDNIDLRPIVPRFTPPERIESDKANAINEDRPPLVEPVAGGTIGGQSVVVQGEFNRPRGVEWTGRIETAVGYTSEDELAWTARGLSVSPIWLDGTHPVETAIERALARGDVFDGSEGSDRFRGYGGADDLRGRGGNDLLKGDSGDDALRGESGRDRLAGNFGDDLIFGGRGRDTLSGGRGDDAMRGGRGEDRFAFREGDGEDVIRDFRQGRDEIAFRSGPERFRDLDIEDTALGAVIGYGEGDSILLRGVEADALSWKDFDF